MMYSLLNPLGNMRGYELIPLVFTISRQPGN